MNWIVGDIHGMLRPLEKLLRQIDRVDPQRELLFVGDYVNRGPDSKGVIELLISLQRARFVRGNHDDVFDQVLCGLSYCSKPGEDQRIVAFRWFMQHGLDKTFLSYGVGQAELSALLRRPSTRLLVELAGAIPRSHREFVRQLPAIIEGDDFFVAHAKWAADLSTLLPSISDRLDASEALRYTLLWGRYSEEELKADKPWERTGYFGHTPVDNYGETPALVPAIGPKMVLLDTGAFMAHGRLTAFCHETGQFLQAE
jgi:serine/threonine protein phosphatase 1